jgi:formylglycine-generating enzyme required for sulfatase activity
MPAGFIREANPPGGLAYLRRVIMKETKLIYLSIFILLLSLIGCDIFNFSDSDDEGEKYNPAPYLFAGTYNLVKVPVPEGGITFPVGIDDDDISRVEKAFYIGETLVTNALWDTVSRWATEEKAVGKYYGLYYDHQQDYKPHPNSTVNEEFNEDTPVTAKFAFGLNAFFDQEWEIPPFYAIPVWCNAFTEWHNEKYGTNLVPVYQDSYGNPIRYLNNYDIFLDTANPDATGFRLPSIEEWELAARWNGNSGINNVTKTIKDVDFSSQPLKFTKGNSASGAKSFVENFVETGKVAIWSNNAGAITYPVRVKTRQANALGIYDMSGNARERTSSWFQLNGILASGIFTRCKGGAIDSRYDELAVGDVFNAGGATTNTGFRVAGNTE